MTVLLLRAGGGALLVFTLVHLLARIAPRLGWVDAPRGALAARKLQDRPVPPVGGVALGLVLAALPWCRTLIPPGAWVGLGLLLAVGVVDDLRAEGLPAWGKLVGQALGLAPLVLAVSPLEGVLDGRLPGAGVFLAGLLLGLVALNLANTFDHADGSLAATLTPGLLVGAPWLAGPVLGFAAANLDGRTGTGSRAPTAYLGDAGAFLLGALVLCEPRLWGTLLLPLLDLLRLSFLRLRGGSVPWVGDRRHLGHRLALGGFSARRGALAVLVIGAPAGIGVALAHPVAALLGALGTVLLYVVALLRIPPDARPGSRLACPGAGPGE